MALSKPQAEIVKDKTRFRVVIAGRRFGKTHLAIRTLAEWAHQPDKEIWYIAPTYKQAKMIAWKKLKKKLISLRWTAKVNESELSITLKNGSTISLKGADNFDNLRGAGLDGLILDEFASIDEEAWYETLRPMLADKQGKALFIGTPTGLNWAYELYNNQAEDPVNWKSFQFTTMDGGNVPAEEIEQARKDLDERTFRQEFMATFETFAGRIYYSFERAFNVRAPENYSTDILYVGSDFNVSPMCSVIAIRQGDSLYVIDEIKMYSSNTDELADEIKSRYPTSKIWVYPDPAGAAKSSKSGGKSDHTILANAGFIVKAPRAHTPVRDRINAVNSRLCSSNGLRQLFVAPNCKYTIECLERQTYKEGTTQPDKDSGYDHMNDALGYMVDYIFPVKRERELDPYAPKRWTHGITA